MRTEISDRFINSKKKTFVPWPVFPLQNFFCLLKYMRGLCGYVFTSKTLAIQRQLSSFFQNIKTSFINIFFEQFFALVQVCELVCFVPPENSSGLIADLFSLIQLYLISMMLINHLEIGCTWTCLEISLHSDTLHFKNAVRKPLKPECI